MAELHVVVGAGPVGRAVTMLRAAAGHQVRVVTRSGSGPEHPASPGSPWTPPTLRRCAT